MQMLRSVNTPQVGQSGVFVTNVTFGAHMVRHGECEDLSSGDINVSMQLVI